MTWTVVDCGDDNNPNDKGIVVGVFDSEQEASEWIGKQDPLKVERGDYSLTSDEDEEMEDDYYEEDDYPEEYYDRDYYDHDYYDHDYYDRMEFADPGGNSALRAATRDNPRNLPCPNCKAPNRLTPKDKALGYCCDRCADMNERGGP